MAQTFLYFKGKAKWARLQQPDEHGNYGMNLYLTQESYGDFMRELKEKDPAVLNVVGKDEDGYFVKFKRPTSKLMRGKITTFAPPVVVDGSKTLPDGSHPPLTDMLGNGSDVTVKVLVYPYNKPTGGKGRATRLESVRVDNLIPYTPKKDFDEGQQNQVEGLSEQPQPLF